MLCYIQAKKIQHNPNSINIVIMGLSDSQFISIYLMFYVEFGLCKQNDIALHFS